MTSRRRRLDLGSVGGVPIGVGLVLIGQALEGGTLRSVLQLTAAVIVFGGTFGAVLVSFSMHEIRRALSALRDVFLETEGSALATIERVVNYAIFVRKKGMMALDDELTSEPSLFLRTGLMLVIDGTSPATIRDTLEAENLGREDLEEAPAKVFEAAGGYAPTIGILGAVLGLIHVMEYLSEPSKLGAGIAVAFVATLYGVGSANLIFLPIATKIRLRARRSAKLRELSLEGILAIQEGLNPRLIEQKLRGHMGLPPVEKKMHVRRPAA